ncbi:MAG: nitrogenase-stabilizing/protective protein NifW [Fluviicoccus sp.]|uniref:nitrogenase-stabilizing/protective protein NifW n=1 Tax=Fluviicoccus sp. TaxID=2003552 RepID=UPI00271DE2F2|nr:nitrogenase-stabilizing/protective protein NifW [Fluviicoccus sp.]MDO8329497.1 nitrogenase-stabilizing/protective protein NifW [Fluviicoccus sp.]
MTANLLQILSGLSLDEAMEELVSAEDFLNFFGIPFDQPVVHVNRLHIMQRYHNYLTQAEMPEAGDEARFEVYKRLLAHAYQDFVNSTALDEKVFKVFQRQGPQKTFVSIDLLE